VAQRFFHEHHVFALRQPGGDTPVPEVVLMQLGWQVGSFAAPLNAPYSA
jgi:hypothetical protein